MKRDRFIPENATETRNEYGVVYSYEYVMQGQRRLFAIGYGGKRTKPDFHYRYPTEEARTKKINDYLHGLELSADAKKARRAEYNKPHTLKVGQILVSRWGYDQTNIDFYEVTEVPSPHYVVIRPIGQHVWATNQTSEEVVPSIGKYTGEAMRKKSNSSNSVSLTSYSSAYPWDGKPKYQTAFGFGH